MSREATAWVWEHCRVPRDKKALLLAIANEVDHDGLDGHPSQRRLAHLLNCGQSTIGRDVTWLEGAGELLVLRPSRRGRGHFTRYSVVMGRDPADLARRIGWPAPRLDAQVVAEVEQLVLAHIEATSRRERDGYVYAYQTIPVAPYPDDGDVDNPVGTAVDDEETRHQARETRQKEPRGGADPQTRAYASPRTEAETKAMIAREREAARLRELGGVDPERIREHIDRARGKIPRSAYDDEDGTTVADRRVTDGAGEGGASTGAPTLPNEDATQQGEAGDDGTDVVASQPDAGTPSESPVDAEPEPASPPSSDRWGERRDLQ